MKKIFIVLISVLLFSLSLYSNKNIKIFISDLSYRSKNQDYSFFTSALAKSIRAAIRETKYEIQYQSKDLRKKQLLKQGFNYKIEGVYFVKQNQMIVRFSVVDIKRNKPIFQASLTGFPDRRVFNLVDALSDKVTSEIKSYKPEEKREFKITRINKQGKLSIENVKLEDNENLKKTDFSGMDLRGKNVNNSNLTDSNLSDTNLSKTDFSGSKLNNAKMKNAKLEEADFSNAKLNNADLSGADLTGADFEGADLRGVNFKGAKFKNTNFKNADFRGVSLNGVTIENTDFTGATFKYKGDHEKGKEVGEKRGFEFRIGLSIGVGISRQTSALMENSTIKVKFSGHNAVRMFLFFEYNFGIMIDLGWLAVDINEEQSSGTYLGIVTHNLYALFAPVIRFSSFYYFAGIYIGAPIDGRYDTESDSNYDLDDFTRPFYGFSTGFGYIINFTNTFSMSVGVDFKYHLVDLMNASGISPKPFSLLFTIGVLFK